MSIAVTQEPGKIKNDPILGINYMEMYGSPEKEPPSAYHKKSKNSYADLLNDQKLHMMNK